MEVGEARLLVTRSAAEGAKGSRGGLRLVNAKDSWLTGKSAFQRIFGRKSKTRKSCEENWLLSAPRIRRTLTAKIL